MKLVDLTFRANSEYQDTDDLIRNQSVSHHCIPFLQKHIEVHVVKHISNPQTIIIHKERFKFFRARNGFFIIPLRAIIYVRSIRPDIVLVHGLLFPIQILLLKLFLRKNVKIIAKHHAERPFLKFRKRFLQWADKYIDAYFFTSRGNADIWLEKGIIREGKKIFEIPDTLSDFKRQDKKASRQALNIGDEQVFLWVGRLDKNKDPLVVLEAFESYFQQNPAAHLYMIYQTSDLLPDIINMLEKSTVLKNAVKLIGKVAYSDLPQWYSAADYFVTGSHSEGGSTALLEAMSSGCIPIVTALPSALKVIDNGRVGYYYLPGSIEGLSQILHTLSENRIHSEHVFEYFEVNYSVTAVAAKIARICEGLVLK